ncbi:hypothetical protein D3C76_1394850 [compost metagenome]
MAEADSSLERYLEGSRTGNTSALLGEFARLTDSPGNCGRFFTPGMARAISPISRTTFSVRSSVAPLGNCAMATT